MRRFGTQGRVYPDRHYVVPRTEEIADFITRVKDGRYIVLFAPRQTGKTTFFRFALDVLTTEDPTYFPIQLDFQIMRNSSPPIFYDRLSQMIRRQIEYVLQKREMKQTEDLTQFLEDAQLSDHFSMLAFFEELVSLLGNQKVVLLIDEFDGIPQDVVVSDFLYTLRHIYLSDELQCPHSVGIVGVKSISQLNYDRSVSPFNIQDEFRLPNFTLQQVQELLAHVKSKCYFFKVMLACYLWTFQYNLSWMKKKLKRGCWIISTFKGCVAQNAKRAWRRHASSVRLKQVVYKCIAANTVRASTTSIPGRSLLARSFVPHRSFCFCAVSVKVFQVHNSGVNWV